MLVKRWCSQDMIPIGFSSLSFFFRVVEGETRNMKTPTQSARNLPNDHSIVVGFLSVCIKSVFIPHELIRPLDIALTLQNRLRPSTSGPTPWVMLVKYIKQSSLSYHREIS